MIKSKELVDPSSCLNRAREDEAVFVLIERECSPETIRFWCSLRVAKGKNRADDPQITEALTLANYIEVQLRGKT